MWNKAIYSGALKDYTYPRDIECCTLLQFLKQVDTTKRVHLTDVIFDKYPVAGYDLYIVCCFGEFINEAFIDKLDNDNNLPEVILITSQLFTTTNYKKVKVFHLEHLHTIRRYFTKEPYLKLASRLNTHGSLSSRSAFHKTFITVKLLQKHSTGYDYTFCDKPTAEYRLDNFANDLNLYYPNIKLTPVEIETIHYLHNNKKTVPGGEWDIDNDIYRDSKMIWATESIFLSRQHSSLAYLTEKTIKPIVSGTGFVLVGQQRVYERLDSLGFKSIIDVDFDYSDDTTRFNKLFDLIDNYDFDELLNSKQAQEIVDYNYNYFWGAFYSHIEYKNRDRITEILDYINEA